MNMPGGGGGGGGNGKAFLSWGKNYWGLAGSKHPSFIFFFGSCKKTESSGRFTENSQLSNTWIRWKKPLDIH